MCTASCRSSLDIDGHCFGPHVVLVLEQTTTEREGWLRCWRWRRMQSWTSRAEEQALLIGIRYIVVLWRWRDHARHLGAFRREGLEVVSPAFKEWVIPLTGDPVRSVRCTERYGWYRMLLRSDHDRVVRCNASPGVEAHRRPSRDSDGTESAPCAALHVRPTRNSFHHPWRGRALRHGRRSALRRPGPFREAAHSIGMVQHRDAGTHAQLFRARGAAARTAG